MKKIEVKKAKVIFKIHEVIMVFLLVLVRGYLINELNIIQLFNIDITIIILGFALISGVALWLITERQPKEIEDNNYLANSVVFVFIMSGWYYINFNYSIVGSIAVFISFMTVIKYEKKIKGLSVLKKEIPNFVVFAVIFTLLMLMKYYMRK